MKHKPFSFYSTEVKNVATQFVRKTSGIFETMYRKNDHGKTGGKSNSSGNEDPKITGEKWLGYLREYTDLLPLGCVLEAGCGNGDFALALSQFLHQDGSYDGFEQDKQYADWCIQNFSGLHPGFRFQHFAIKTGYQPTQGETNEGCFTLPYPDQQFDLFFSRNELTQVLPDEMDQYLSEISRVLKPGGTCLIMLFIVNCESENLMITRPTQMNFTYNKGLYRLQSKHANTQVAYDEEWLLDKVESAGLKMETIRYGSWCGRKRYLEFEDMLICSKV
jgi:SAM-dependent methyltransferase